MGLVGIYEEIHQKIVIIVISLLKLFSLSYLIIRSFPSYSSTQEMTNGPTIMSYLTFRSVLEQHDDFIYVCSIDGSFYTVTFHVEGLA